MKKILLLIPVLCILAFQTVNAQLEQGNILVGSTSTMNIWGDHSSDFMALGLSTNKYNGSDPYKCIAFNLIPKAGYFVIDNLAAGLETAISFWSEKNSNSDSKESQLGIVFGPFVRFYYPLDDIYPFVEVNAGIGANKYKYSYGSYDDEEGESIFMFGLGVGAAKPLGERITFDAIIGYSNVSWKEKDEEVNEKSTSGTIGLKLGFTIFFIK